MKEYLLLCSDCNEYTSLGQYLPKNSCFEGEYSLLHNKHANDNELLCKFLIQHLEHSLKMIQSQTEEFSQIIGSSNRFLENLIDDYVLENYQRQRNVERERNRSLTEVQFSVIESILKEEAESIANIPSQTPAESQFWLGKEHGLKKAKELLKEWKGKLMI